MTTTGGTSGTTSVDEAGLEIVGLACRAPSVHNTQPWRWRAADNRVWLRADRTRQLVLSDPDARNLMISCGAALHHVLVAAAGLGRPATVARFPDPEDPDLVAIIDLGEHTTATPEQIELLEALKERRTDRRRFTSWPVPDERLVNLATDARRRGARVLPLTGSAARATVERLIDQALRTQSSNQPLLEEQRRWIEHSSQDGIPRLSLPVQEHPSERADRFHRYQGPSPFSDRVVTSDGVLVVCTATDTASAWVDAGETLSALWLAATVGGFSLVPLSQVTEVEETRRELRERVLYGMAQPQLLARIGWQEITRPELPPTPRRPISDVLQP